LSGIIKKKTVSESTAIIPRVSDSRENLLLWDLLVSFIVDNVHQFSTIGTSRFILNFVYFSYFVYHFGRREADSFGGAFILTANAPDHTAIGIRDFDFIFIAIK